MSDFDVLGDDALSDIPVVAAPQGFDEAPPLPGDPMSRQESEKHLSPEIREYIDAIWKLAHATGYAEKAAERLPTAPPQVRHDPELPLEIPNSSQTAARVSTRTFTGQLPRGLGQKYVEEYVQALGNEPVSVKDIIKGIQNERGIKVSDQSVARALDKLIKQGIIERIPDTHAFQKSAKLRVVG